MTTKSIDEAFAVLAQNREELITNLNRRHKLAVQRRNKADGEIAEIKTALAELGIKSDKRVTVTKIRTSVTTVSNTVIDKTKMSAKKIKFSLIGRFIIFLLIAVLVSAVVTSIPVIRPYGWLIWILTIAASIVLAIPSKNKE